MVRRLISNQSWLIRLMGAILLAFIGAVVLRPVGLLIPTADAVETELALMMLIALACCLGNIQYILRRLRAMERARENGILLFMRRGALADQIKLAIMSLLLLIVGVVAMFMPPRSTPAGPVEIFTGVLFMGVAILLMWLSIDNRLRPFNLRREMEAEARHHDAR